MDCALFTITRNEKFFLPIWYKYYSQQIGPKNIFILDHESTDDSTCCYQNVIKINNKFTQDHKWMSNLCSDFQKKLLEEYRWVIFSHVDEFICPDPDRYTDLKDFLFKNRKIKKIRCKGYEVIQFPEESAISESNELLKKRKYWFQNDVYSKPLIAQVAVRWTPGWHGIYEEQLPIEKDLLLIHLHRIDYQKCYEKRFLIKKENIYRPDLEKKWGWYIDIKESDFKKWFYSIKSARILDAKSSFLNFEKNKNKKEQNIIEEAMELCDSIEEKWKNKL